jgi:hypothetical protein
MNWINQFAGVSYFTKCEAVKTKCVVIITNLLTFFTKCEILRALYKENVVE